ncbi:MAG: DNA repair ATPase, partial [Chitinophagaceae bacterium]|nr:DNA repair ATPase [Chitinophagaceae bacterium]
MSEQVVQQTLEAGTYEVIRDRLKHQREVLDQRLHSLNEARKTIFGSTETKLIAQNRMVTENNCVAQDIIAFGNRCILGYNVHFGLRTDIGLQDVFSIYQYTNGEFVAESLDFLHNENFINDFGSLYKYYRSTRFYRFIVIGNYLYMVFQLSDRVTDIKTFKWLIADDSITYLDNRSDFEYRFPAQHDFEWVTATRDMHRNGRHPHIAILNKVFVDTIGGTLTIKVEDNTNEGAGIYNEPVANADQTLDDGHIEFADLGNLIALSIKPFQEEARYFVYNHKLREVKQINSIKHAAILLPDQQGIIFSNGYYLQSGEYKIFETSLEEVTFQQRLSSPNGEDFLYVFFQKQTGRYVLMMYNVINQSVGTPIICNGYALLEGGRLCYFVAEADQTRSHVVQVWQTPFADEVVVPEAHRTHLLYKIGNKAIVRAMAECRNLIVLLQKEDSYSGLYTDLVRAAQNLLDGYFWIHEPDAFAPGEPVAAIKATANTAIDEFEKVTALRQAALDEARQIREKAEQALGKIKSASFRSIEDFTTHLTALRNLRGEVISRREVRYIDLNLLAGLEKQLVEQSDRLSHHCVTFLNGPQALEPYTQRVAAQKPLLDAVTKVVEGKKLEADAHAIGTDLELLIEVVSNLKIEDTSQATRIIDNISLIFTGLNQLKAAIRNKIDTLATA